VLGLSAKVEGEAKIRYKTLVVGSRLNADWQKSAWKDELPAGSASFP
jgi:hypothetical protein